MQGRQRGERQRKWREGTRGQKGARKARDDRRRKEGATGSGHEECEGRKGEEARRHEHSANTVRGTRRAQGACAGAKGAREETARAREMDGREERRGRRARGRACVWRGLRMGAYGCEKVLALARGASADVRRWAEARKPSRERARGALSQPLLGAIDFCPTRFSLGLRIDLAWHNATGTVVILANAVGGTSCSFIVFSLCGALGITQ
ncbi:hypothetical protein DENSPDRAFT_279056 [Dentipellis sp. KUC8613]|nr:hypothetical protein DENSPDRAFT_279056 [Dentipellis sp. KUC8613]